MGELDPRIDGYDWEMAFQCCGAAENGRYACNSPRVSQVLGSEASVDPFQRADVAEVIAVSDGENDGPNWIGVFRLNDGRYAFLAAGCDYGWDCQSGGYAMVALSLQDLIRLGLGDEDRVRLNLSVSDGTG